jgi:uncharacterized protein YkwD
MHRLATAWISSSLLLISAPFLIGAADLTTNVEARLLAAHNRERTSMGLPALQWNRALEASATHWADRLASTSSFEHAPENLDSPQGENLWAGSSGYYPPEAMVNAWIREKRHFKEGMFPNNSTTGRVEDVGHYTQVVWRDSRNVGCAIARGKIEDILVCRYSKAGNYLGQRPY